MKTITFTLSTDGEAHGSFTLDPYTQLRLIADAKANPKLSLTEYVREALRDVTLRDDYPGTIHCCDDRGDIAAVSAELAASSQI